MIPKRYLEELGRVRARFIDRLCKQCNKPRVSTTPMGDTIIHDGPIKMGVVVLEVTNSDSGINFQYVLEKPKPKVKALFKPKDIEFEIKP